MTVRRSGRRIVRGTSYVGGGFVSGWKFALGFVILRFAREAGTT